jgi:hypothetical protein
VLHVNIDANFRSRNQDRKRSAENPPVLDGQAYMVAQEPFHDYLKSVIDEVEVSRSLQCSTAMKRTHSNATLSFPLVSTSRHLTGQALRQAREFGQAAWGA